MNAGDKRKLMASLNQLLKDNNLSHFKAHEIVLSTTTSAVTAMSLTGAKPNCTPPKKPILVIPKNKPPFWRCE